MCSVCRQRPPMSFPFYQAPHGLMQPGGAGLIPQGAVPIYGAATPAGLFPAGAAPGAGSAQFPMRGILAASTPPGGQMTLLSADPMASASTSPTPTTGGSMLRGLRPGQGGLQTVLMGPGGMQVAGLQVATGLREFLLHCFAVGQIPGINILYSCRSVINQGPRNCYQNVHLLYCMLLSL